MKGALPRLARWARRAGTREFFPALAALVSPVQNIFLAAHFFPLCVPIAQQPGQAIVPGCLSLYLCLWAYLPMIFAQSKKNYDTSVHLVRLSHKCSY